MATGSAGVHRRRRGAAAIGLVALVGALFLTATSGSPTRAASSTLRFGIATGGLGSMSNAELAKTFADVAAIGADLVRTDLDWGTVQPASPDSWSWGAFDRVVAAANVHHLEVLPILDYTPAWARAFGCSTQFCPPADPGRFAAFAAAAVARYASKGVHAWEIWNEPNSAAFWSPQADPAAYARLLRATVPAMRRADGRATVVSGGLAPEPTAAGNVTARTYLSDLCRAGVLPLVDAIGVHPYSSPVPPGYPADWNAWQQMGSAKVNLVGILSGCGQSGKKLWATEYGAATNGPGAESTPGNYNLAEHPDHVSEALQAEMASQSVQLGTSAPWLGALIWYSGRDLGTLAYTNQNFFGLRRNDGSAKPAWNAFHQAIGAARHP